MLAISQRFKSNNEEVDIALDISMVSIHDWTVVTESRLLKILYDASAYILYTLSIFPHAK